MAETFFRSQIDAILIVASWVDRLQKEVGLSNVSQVWSEHPAWYLWLDGAPGAHELELIETGEKDHPDAALLQARFAVKLYPRPGHPVMQGFSVQEQDLAQGPFFDEHHTPTFEGREQIAPQLFQTGMIELTTIEETDWALFTLCALDRCVCRQQDSGQDPIRDVPGWDLSYDLFTRLLTLYAFSAKKPPARVSLIKEPGFSQVITPQGVSTQPDPSGQLRSLSVLFCADPSSPPGAAMELMNQAAGDNPLGTVFDLSFSCGHVHADQLGPSEREVLSQQWWHYAGVDYKSELASSCGCEH